MIFSKLDVMIRWLHACRRCLIDNEHMLADGIGRERESERARERKSERERGRERERAIAK